MADFKAPSDVLNASKNTKLETKVETKPELVGVEQENIKPKVNSATVNPVFKF